MGIDQVNLVTMHEAFVHYLPEAEYFTPMLGIAFGSIFQAHPVDLQDYSGMPTRISVPSTLTGKLSKSFTPIFSTAILASPTASPLFKSNLAP